MWQKVAVWNAASDTLTVNDDSIYWINGLKPAPSARCSVGQQYVAPNISEVGSRPGCRQCQPGYSSEDGIECRACGPGMFAPEGSRDCTSCDVRGNFFQELAGQSECEPCPAGTQRYLDLGPGIKNSTCQCKEGYWRPNQQPGRMCAKCLEGSSCPGRTFLPTPDEGYWAPYREENCSEMQVVGTKKPSERTCRVLALDPKAITDDRLLDDPFNLVYDLRSQQLFLECSTPTQCPGNFECGDGYSGRACAVCDRGYFRLMSSCYACPSGESSFPSMLMTVCGITGVISVWGALNYLTAGNNDALDIGLLYMQVVSIVQSFSIHWPEELSSVTQVFSIVNFDVRNKITEIAKTRFLYKKKLLFLITIASSA